VKIVEPLCDLLEEPSASSFWDLPVRATLLHILMKTDTSNVVSDNTDLLGRLNKVMHPDDVGVVDLFES